MAGKRWRKGRKNKEGVSEAKFSTLVTFSGSKPGLPTKAVADGPGWAPFAADHVRKRLDEIFIKP